jgi:hypothetical protein
MLPKVANESWPPEPVSGIRVRSANFERELAAWFEEMAAAPPEPAIAPPKAPVEAPEEPRSARIPFLIF